MGGTSSRLRKKRDEEIPGEYAADDSTDESGKPSSWWDKQLVSLKPVLKKLYFLLKQGEQKLQSGNLTSVKDELEEIYEILFPEGKLFTHFVKMMSWRMDEDKQLQSKLTLAIHFVWQKIKYNKKFKGRNFKGNLHQHMDIFLEKMEAGRFSEEELQAANLEVKKGISEIIDLMDTLDRDDSIGYCAAWKLKSQSGGSPFVRYLLARNGYV
jgi:hypothetical protein